MRKPNPTRYTGQVEQNRAADKLEMKGFSVPQMEETTKQSKRKPGKSQRSPAIAKQPTMQPSNRDTMTPSNHATTVSRYRETIIDLVRKAVKELGKEAATHRFTITEKKVLAEIIFAYRSRNTKTNENEITRIAVNFIINDYKENGENSVLDQVLTALNE